MKNSGAVALGSIKTAKKSASSAANGKLGGRPTNYELAQRKVAHSPKLSEHSETIFSDWPNWNDHLKWVISAPVSEIVEWAEEVESA